MDYKIKDDRRIPFGSTFIFNGEKYGAGDWTNQQKLAEVEAKPVIEPEYDKDFYIFNEVGEAETAAAVTVTGYQTERFDIEVLKSFALDKVDEWLAKRLAGTDHVILHALESGAEVSQVVRDTRAGFRRTREVAALEISKATDYAKLVSYVREKKWL